jgi:glycerophosphoryl diester phosphodiesterase
MTRIASHRGGTLEYGDSTPAGFAATARMALEEVEFDLHPTADGEIIVHHDATLDRTTDGRGAIASLNASNVLSARINYGQGGSPLTLPQLCKVFANSPVVFRCEIKPGVDGQPYPGFVPKVVAQLAALGRLETTNFSSFLLDTLAEIATACDRPRLWLVSPAVLHQLGRDAVIQIARARGIPEIGVHVDDADAGLIAQVRAAGMEFGCWAAHSVPQIEKALALGVKVFTTDRPSLAIVLRNASREQAQ